MTTMQQPAESAATDTTQKEDASATGPSFLSRLLIIIGLVVLLIVGTYALGWYNAYRLSERFMRHASESYQQGDYVISLTGQEAFDAEEEQYVKRGGYLDVQHIWSHRYSWPTPGVVDEAEQRAERIIYEELTIQQAEQYIQANIGRSAPYFAEIYFHLGELYMQEGDEAAAREIYESIPQLFPTREDLIEQAGQHLEQMES